MVTRLSSTKINGFTHNILMTYKIMLKIGRGRENMNQSRLLSFLYIRVFHIHQTS